MKKGFTLLNYYIIIDYIKDRKSFKFMEVYMKSAEFIKQFIDTLGDVKNWEHNGVVVELPFPSGQCVCGHPIKFEYYIVNKITKQKEKLGSECINHFKDYNLELYEALIASKTNFKEKKKKEKLQPVIEELSVLKEELTKYIKAIVEYRTQVGFSTFIDRELWGFWFDTNKLKEYKTVNGEKKYIASLIEQGKYVFEKFNLDIDDLLLKANKREKVKMLFKNEAEKNNDFIKLANQNDVFEESPIEKIEQFLSDYKEGKLTYKTRFRIDVLGKTYPIKDTLKSQGFSWNGEAWYKYSYDENEPVLKSYKNITIFKVDPCDKKNSYVLIDGIKRHEGKGE